MASRVRSGDGAGRENDVARFDNEVDIPGIAELRANNAVGVGECAAQARNRDLIRYVEQTIGVHKHVRAAVDGRARWSRRRQARPPPPRPSCPRRPRRGTPD